MHVLDETDLLLDLLREAGDEPVTLDELQIVGVQQPAQALLALELAGHAVHRVYEVPRAGQSITCVRLRGPLPRVAEAEAEGVAVAVAEDEAVAEAEAVAEPAPTTEPAVVFPASAPAPAPEPDPAAQRDRRLILAAVIGALLLALLAAGRRR